MNPSLEAAARSLYGANIDDNILALCIKSQEEIDGDRHRRERLAKLDKEIAKKNRQLAKKDQQISEKDQQISEKDQQISEKDQRIAFLTAKLKAQGLDI